MSCRWNGKDQPRIVAGRHEGDCWTLNNGEGDCSGCLPCTEPHCRVCRMAHAGGTCAECMAETRETLRGIGRMCDALPEEVESRGINGEAMMLLGPAADPEARGHLEASVLAGRVPADYLDEADDEMHPLFVLGTWDMAWRDALEHDEPDERLTVASAVDYLDRQLTYMAGFEHVPFEDFARDLRRCSAHLEAVLHDGEQVEHTRIQCLEDGCTGHLVKSYAATEDHDGWACSRCGTFYDHGRKARALHDQLASEGAAKWVRVAEALSAIPRPEQTLRTWINSGEVQSQRDGTTGQVYVWWPDVRTKHIEAGMRKRKRDTNGIHVLK